MNVKNFFDLFPYRTSQGYSGDLLWIKDFASLRKSSLGSIYFIMERWVTWLVSRVSQRRISVSISCFFIPSLWRRSRATRLPGTRGYAISTDIAYGDRSMVLHSIHSSMICTNTAVSIDERGELLLFFSLFILLPSKLSKVPNPYLLSSGVLPKPDSKSKKPLPNSG